MMTKTTGKTMEARYAGRCHECGGDFEAGTKIHFAPKAARGWKTAHVDCPETAAMETDEPREIACPITGEPMHDTSANRAAAERDHAWGHLPGCWGECDGEGLC